MFSILTRTKGYSIDEMGDSLIAQEERFQKHKDDFSMQQMPANMMQYQQNNRGRGKTSNRGGGGFQHYNSIGRDRVRQMNRGGRQTTVASLAALL